MFSEIKIKKSKTGEIVLNKQGKEITVKLVKCFPWSHPEGMIAMVDRDGATHEIIDEIDNLRIDERLIVQQYFDILGDIPRVESILEIEEEREFRHFEVMTQFGALKFQTELDSWPLPCPDGDGWYISDINGDLYRFASLSKLDSESRDKLSFLVE